MRQRGQVLIEALVALSVSVAIIAAITTLVVSSLNNAETASDQTAATHYAQQGIETVRRISESDWTVFSNYNGTFCLGQGDTSLSQPGPDGCGQNIGKFVRQVTIETQGCEGIENVSKVIVDVSWADNECTSESNPFCHKVRLDTCLTNTESEVN